MNVLDSWLDSLKAGSARRKASTYTGQYKERKKRTHIHASSGIRTYDSNVPEIQKERDLNRAATGAGSTFQYMHWLLTHEDSLVP